MTKPDQSGAVNGLVLSLIVAILLLIGALGFGGWAFSSRQDYKNNVDSKISAAVDTAKQQQGAADQVKFNEEAKQPLRTYQGPEPSGSVIVSFPKTWSAYINDTSGGGLVDGYFAPGIVPATSSSTSVFALRVQVLQRSYAQVVGSLSSQLKAGKITSTAYALPKVPKVVGLKVVGKLNGPVTETMVVLPIRSNTLEIWTQGDQFLNDFNNNILPNVSFSP